MKKRLTGYLAYWKSVKIEEFAEEEKERMLKDLLIQIGFFQHERLIHLLVTLAFAIFAVAGILVINLFPEIWAIALEVLFVVLLVPYVKHYYLLENGVQKLYEYYDAITKPTTK